MAYQIINLETGEFATLTLEEAAALVQLDPHEIEWAIEEHGVCETETHQITKLAEAPEGDGEGDDDDAGDGEISSFAAGSGKVGAADQAEVEGGFARGAHSSGGDDDDASDADSIIPLPVFVYISQAEFEARRGRNGSAWPRLSKGLVCPRSNTDVACAIASLRVQTISSPTGASATMRGSSTAPSLPIRAMCLLYCANTAGDVLIANGTADTAPGIRALRLMWDVCKMVANAAAPRIAARRRNPDRDSTL